MPKPGKPPTRRKPYRKSKYIPRKKVCSFCVNKVRTIDYKDISLLRRFVSDRGRIEPRRKTGVCAKHQRVLSVALKRARHVALLPYTAEHFRSTGALSPREPAPRDLPRRGAATEEISPKEPGAEEQQAG